MVRLPTVCFPAVHLRVVYFAGFLGALRQRRGCGARLAARRRSQPGIRSGLRGAILSPAALADDDRDVRHAFALERRRDLARADPALVKRRPGPPSTVMRRYRAVRSSCHGCCRRWPRRCFTSFSIGAPAYTSGISKARALRGQLSANRIGNATQLRGPGVTKLQMRDRLCAGLYCCSVSRYFTAAFVPPPCPRKKSGLGRTRRACGRPCFR